MILVVDVDNYVMFKTDKNYQLLTLTFLSVFILTFIILFIFISWFKITEKVYCHLSNDKRKNIDENMGNIVKFENFRKFFNIIHQKSLYL